MEGTPQTVRGDSAGRPEASAESPVSTALEHLVTGSQGVITKRIDLALLEAQELLTRTLQRAALGALSIVLAAAAWFTVTTSFILVVIPSEPLSVRLAAFGLLHGGVALGLVALARRRGGPLVLRSRNVAMDTIEGGG